MSRIVDTYITYRIIKTLVKPWKEQDAYKLGIIDDKGKVLKKTKQLKTTPLHTYGALKTPKRWPTSIMASE